MPFLVKSVMDEPEAVKAKSTPKHAAKESEKWHSRGRVPTNTPTFPRAFMFIQHVFTGKYSLIYTLRSVKLLCFNTFTSPFRLIKYSKLILTVISRNGLTNSYHVLRLSLSHKCMAYCLIPCWLNGLITHFERRRLWLLMPKRKQG